MKVISRLTHTSAVLTALIALALTPVAQADVPAVTFTEPLGQAFSLGADSTVGWSFTLSTAMTVTSLGFHSFSPNSSGASLVTSHEVAIWNAGGQEIADGTVPAGTAGTNVNGTYYVSIAPVMLSVGTYTIGAFVPSGTDYTDINDTVTAIPGVTYNGSRSNFVAGFSDPTGNQIGYSNAYFGPDFQVVPEPSTWALLGLGATGMGVALRRRRCPRLA